MSGRVLTKDKPKSPPVTMFARLCFWKPHNKGNNKESDFSILQPASEDLDELALQDEEYDEIHQWERESLNDRAHLHQKSSLSACTSFNHPSALVRASGNEIECTHSTTTSDDSLGSLITAASDALEKAESRAERLSETRSNQSSIMSVSFDEKYAQLLMYSQDDESDKVSELDASALSHNDDGEDTISEESDESTESDESQSDEQSVVDSYMDEDTNDGYKADDDECSAIDNVPSDEHTGSLGIAYPHPAHFHSEAESLAWQSDATEMTRILQRYDTGMCCAGNDSESSDSSVWSDVR